MITYNQLIYLTEVVKQQNFTKAAEKLYVSQSTLSKSLKALEEELDVEIITRNSKSFALTNEGKEVFAYAERILNFVNSETHDLRQQLHGSAGSLTLGIPPTAGSAYFNSRIYAFHEAYPDVHLRIEETPSNVLIEKMEAGNIDMGIVLEPFVNSSFIRKPVCRSEIGVCVSKDHPLASRGRIALKELSNESFLMMTPDYMFRNIVDEYCRQAGFTPKVIFESSQWDMLYDMAASNFGVVFLPFWLMEKWEKSDVSILHIEQPQMPWIMSICYQKSRHLTEPMRNFLSFCQEETSNESNS